MIRLRPCLAGSDGRLEAWRVLLPVLARRLAATRRAFVEIGFRSQAGPVTELAQPGGSGPAQPS